MKQRKFKTGGDTGDYMAEIRKRAIEYAKMADKAGGTEETEEQKAFIRQQAGRENYGRSNPAPRPQPKKATPKSQPDAVTQKIMDRFRQQTKDEIERQKLQDKLDKDAIPAGSRPNSAASETRAMRSSAPDVPEMSTEQPPAGRKSFGSRVLDSLTQGGAGDIRNMLGSAAPTFARGSKSIADIYNTMREGKRRAAMEKAGKPTGRRNADVERMESESPASVTPRMPRRQEAPGPRDMDELRMSGEGMGFKKGGKTKKYAQGGSVSARADGIAKRGKTNCKIC
jgi:hypothetical protein